MNVYKRNLFRPSIFLILLLIFLLSGCMRQNNTTFKYGVFIGANAEQIDLFLGYDIVVIDAAYYSKADIDKLHQNDIVVYSYLNIGSIESFRDFFPTYEHLILDEYEDWPDEYWIDVSNSKWKEQIDKQADSLTLKGVDGFFIDNTDVYYQYHNPAIFQGLVDILNELNQYQNDIIINGGDVFVTEAIIETDSPAIEITGINQECVFTNIDFQQEKFVRQDIENTNYYQDYIESCSKKSLKVYLLEYSRNNSLSSQIETYCKAHQFHYFISPSLNLDGDF